MGVSILRTWICILIISFILLFSGCGGGAGGTGGAGGGPSSTDMGNFQGRLLDEQNRGIEGAAMNLSPGSYTSDTDTTGFFGFIVPVNTYRASVFYEGETFEINDEIDVRKDVTTSINFNFSPVEGYIISHPLLGLAFLTDISSVDIEALGYSVLAGADITLTGAPAGLVTDGNGYFRFDRVISGLQTLDVSFDTGQIEEILVVTSNNDTSNLVQSEPVIANITMLSGSIRQFLVYGVNDGGELILPLDINWTVVDSNVGTVNTEGIFIAGSPGTTEVFADFAGTRVTIVVTVTTGVGNITGKVVDGLTGQPAAGVTIGVSGVASTVTTDASGEYFLERIPASLNVILTASRDGVLMASKSVFVLPDETITEDIVLNSFLLNPPSVASIDDGLGEGDKDPNPYTSTVNFEISGSNFGFDREAVEGEVTFIDVDDSSKIPAVITEWQGNMIKGNASLGTDEVKKYIVRVTVMGESSSEEVYFYKGCQWEYLEHPDYRTTYLPHGDTDIEIYNDIPYVAFERRDEASGETIASVISLNGSSWDFVGESNISTLPADNVCLSIYNGTLYIAYNLYQDGGNARVKYYDTSSGNWQDLGAQTFFTESADYLSLCASSEGVYLSYIADGGKPLVVRYNYTAGTWSDLGNPSQAAVECSWTDLYLGNDDIPYIAYKNNSTFVTGPILVEKYEGGTWGPVGGSIVDGTLVCLCIDNNGGLSPYLAYIDGSKPSVTRDYSYVGERNFTEYGADRELDMCVGQDGYPCIVYVEIPDVKKATVMKYTGKGDTGWEFVGVREATPFDTTDISITEYNNNYYLSYQLRENAWPNVYYHLRVMKTVYRP